MVDQPATQPKQAGRRWTQEQIRELQAKAVGALKSEAGQVKLAALTAMDTQYYSVKEMLVPALGGPATDSVAAKRPGYELHWSAAGTYLRVTVGTHQTHVEWRYDADKTNHVRGASFVHHAALRFLLLRFVEKDPDAAEAYDRSFDAARREAADAFGRKLAEYHKNNPEPEPEPAADGVYEEV
jgi:hypothetical protein